MGEYTYNEKKAGFTADLRDAAKVTFEKGAYVIPMDQVSGNVICHDHGARRQRLQRL